MFSRNSPLKKKFTIILVFDFTSLLRICWIYKQTKQHHEFLFVMSLSQKTLGFSLKKCKHSKDCVNADIATLVNN